MISIFKCWRILIAIMTLTILAAGGGLVLWSGSEIANPPRRSLMDYHREYRINPAAHGMRIEQFTASDGTPCLVCTSSSSGALGDRGKRIRQQLSERGFKLTSLNGVAGTLVLLHGRKGRKEDFLPIAERLCAAGFRCVIPDLPGHGDHPAALATYGIREASLPSRVLMEAAGRFSFDPQPAGLLGMSMGGSVLMHAADRSDAPWKALAVISSFDSFPKVIHDQASQRSGLTLGAWWAKGANRVYQWKSGIQLSEIQPHRHASSIKIPTLMAHGSLDRVVTISRGKSLYDSLPGSTTKRWLEIPGAGHDNVLITDYPIYADLAEWMLLHLVIGNES